MPEEAPDFRIETLDGEEFSLSAHRGQVVVVNFWATWCGPCLGEIPHFNRFAEKNPDVKIIGIAVKSPTKEVEKKVEEMGISYEIAQTRPKDSILDDYAMNKSRTVFPTTFVIDATGIIIGGRIERALSYEELEEVVKRASDSS